MEKDMQAKKLKFPTPASAKFIGLLVLIHENINCYSPKTKICMCDDVTEAKHSIRNWS